MDRQNLDGARKLLDRMTFGATKGKRRLVAKRARSPNQRQQRQGEIVKQNAEGHSRHRLEDARERLSVSLRNGRWPSASSTSSPRALDMRRSDRRTIASFVSASLDAEWENQPVVGIYAMLAHNKLKYTKAKLEGGCFLSAINERLVKAYNLTVREVQEVAHFQPVYGSSVTSRRRTILSIKIIPWEIEYPAEFWVLAEDTMAGDMLLGLKFLNRNGLKQDGPIWMRAVAEEWKV